MCVLYDNNVDNNHDNANDNDDTVYDNDNPTIMMILMIMIMTMVDKATDKFKWCEMLMSYQRKDVLQQYKIKPAVDDFRPQFC